MSRKFKYMLVVGFGIFAILLFLLASASENTAFFDQHYPWLLGLNALVAAMLLSVVFLLLTRLAKRYRRKKFGSRFMARLVMLFAVIGILPGLLIYLVSVQFVSRSIESWFDIRIESALEAGLNLGRNSLDSALTELSDKGRNIALELADKSDSAQLTYLSRLRDQSLETSIFNANGQVIATVGGQLGALSPEAPTPAMMRQAASSRGFAVIENVASGAAPRRKVGSGDSEDNDSENDLRLHVVLEIPASMSELMPRSNHHYLQIIQAVPSYLATNANTLRIAYTEYQQRSVSRSGLRKIYLVTLTLTLLLAIFGAIVSAFVIASDLAKPLLLLAEGTKAVAEGNLSPRPIVATSDELGTLTKSFNTMTRQLLEARDTVERNRIQLEEAKAYLESVLANMSAGVVVLDDGFRLITSNDSVKRILQLDFAPYIGQPLVNVDGLAAFALAITNAFSEQSAQLAANAAPLEKLHWQQQIELPRLLDGADDEKITVLARGSRLPVENGIGYVVVFDDISDVISAQRSIAWGEVARRLAHEIKNPLTPIQLSAERLQMRLIDKLEPPDATILNKSTSTIVNQVTAMKRMVDDFRDYARTPPAQPAELDLNDLIAEILNLYLSGDGRDVIHATLAPQLPHVMGDATQLRQVIHNLLQNAQDAVNDQAVTPADPAARPRAPRIDIVTEVVNYQTPAGAACSAVRLTIRDNGPGFSQKILARAFEPYVTSKARGTGLGLAMVKKIIDEHGGKIDLQNRSGESGAKISILLLKLAG
ncbi:HAMP domain-containing protein [Oxalobacteraceae bacterium CAVE-383]|nr:HAMP domain-containing protein [Oxalobacteraceae bacterium CAVE-383]